MEAVPSDAIPDLSNSGLTFKELYKSEERNVDDSDMRRMWGPKVNGKSCYRFRLLKENKKEEFLSLYRKIHDRKKVLGGQVPQALAVAFLLHCNGREINWMSFYKHAKSAAKSRAISNNDYEDGLENGTANVVPQVTSSPIAPVLVDKPSSQIFISSNVTCKTKMNNANYAKKIPEMSRILEEWISIAEHDVSRLTIALRLSDDKCSVMKETLKGLEARQVRVANEIKKYEDLITKLSSAAKEGVEAVIDLQKRELEELGVDLKQALDDLFTAEISRDAELEQLNKLRPCLKRLLASRSSMCQPFEFDPCLPTQTPIVVDSTKEDSSINLNEACPFCYRSLTLDEILLPIIIAECRHAYHVACCVAHFSCSMLCCYTNCGHNMSKSWLSFLGLKGCQESKISITLDSHEKLSMKGFSSTPASVSYPKEHKLLPRRLSTALTIGNGVMDNVTYKQQKDNDDSQGQSATDLECHDKYKNLISIEENELNTAVLIPLESKGPQPEDSNGKHDASDTASSPFGKKHDVRSPPNDEKTVSCQSKLSNSIRPGDKKVIAAAKNDSLREAHGSLRTPSCSPILKAKNGTSYPSQSEGSISPGNTVSLATRKSKRGEACGEAQAFGSPSMSPCTKRIKSHKKLLIFELDGVLLKLFENTEPLPSCVMDGAELKHLNHTKLAVLRPRARDLLDWCMEHFEIAVWTRLSSTATNLIISQMFQQTVKQKLQFTWSSGKCTNTSFKIDRKPIMLKELSKVYHESKGVWTEKNTLLIDDMLYHGFKNSPHSMVCPNTYQPSRIDGDFLYEHLKPWLEGLLEADNVEGYAKANPLTNFLDKVSKRAVDILKKYRYH